jgi:hypothetical protein
MTASRQPATPGRFHGWQRVPPSKRWERVTEGTTEDEARAGLWDVPFAGRTRDVVVLPAGRDPNTAEPASRVRA